jgi:hypothetical protein
MISDQELDKPTTDLAKNFLEARRRSQRETLNKLNNISNIVTKLQNLKFNLSCLPKNVAKDCALSREEFESVFINYGHTYEEVDVTYKLDEKLKVIRSQLEDYMDDVSKLDAFEFGIKLILFRKIMVELNKNIVSFQNKQGLPNEVHFELYSKLIIKVKKAFFVFASIKSELSDLLEIKILDEEEKTIYALNEES